MDSFSDRPSTVRAEEALGHRGPWKFLIRAMPGGFSHWGIQLVLAWASFQAFATWPWIVYLKAKLGNSALANEWGELLVADDIWEVMENGQLQDSILGFWTISVGILAMLWVLWASWKLQAKTVKLEARLMPWLVSVPTALLVGYLPLWVLHALLWNMLAYLGSLGIQFLGWINLIVGPLLHMAFGSALMLQWWLCRLDLALHFPKCKQEWTIHLKDSFLRLWSHPVQWGNIIFIGVAIRAGLALWVLFLGWGCGGQNLSDLRMFFLLQTLAATTNAWIIGWILRIAALYWENDTKVRYEVRMLEKSNGQKQNPEYGSSTSCS